MSFKYRVEEAGTDRYVLPPVGDMRCEVVAFLSPELFERTDEGVPRVKIIDRGCDDYAAKPIDRERLVSMVAEYASRQELQKHRGTPVA